MSPEKEARAQWMKANPRVAGRFLVACLLILALGLPACAESPSTLAPQGPGAAHIARLAWLLFGLGAAVYLGVMAFLFVAARRKAEVSSPSAERRIILYGGVIVPAVILVVVFGFTLYTLVALSAITPANAQNQAQNQSVVIEVVGRQWWWEVHYPYQQVQGANEIHIPVGQPIEIKLASADVIHSFWVPQLHGKLDLVPGQINSFWLQADEPGAYWGECAEFCGIQHAKMAFVVVAEAADAFEAWLAAQSQPAAAPADPLAQRGQAVFAELNCPACHTIRGAGATGVLGPDLTHLASRQRIGAGTLPNSRGNLGGWVVDPHGVKPGVLMPATAVTGEELQALLAYLESLK